MSQKEKCHKIFLISLLSGKLLRPDDDGVSKKMKLIKRDKVKRTWWAKTNKEKKKKSSVETKNISRRGGIIKYLVLLLLKRCTICCCFVLPPYYKCFEFVCHDFTSKKEISFSTKKLYVCKHTPYNIEHSLSKRWKKKKEKK